MSLEVGVGIGVVGKEFKQSTLAYTRKSDTLGVQVLPHKT